MAPTKLKSPKQAKKPESEKIDKNLAFLWACFECKSGQVSIPEVADILLFD